MTGCSHDDDISDIHLENGKPEEPQFFGAMADKLEEWAKAKKDKTTQGPEVYDRLAGFITDQLEMGFVAAELDQSIKDYPPLKNVPLAWAPELEKDLFEHNKFTKDLPLKATEVALKSIQRGVASSINALGPLAEVVMRQGAENEELDGVSTTILDVIRLLSNALTGLTKKRRDLLRHILDAKYHKLGKGDEDFDHKFLFGGSLTDRARKVKAADSLMNEILKKDTRQNGSGGQASGGQRRSHPYGGGHHRNGGQHNGTRHGYRQNGQGGSRPYQGRSSGGQNRGHSGSNHSNQGQGKRDFRKQGPPNNKNN